MPEEPEVPAGSTGSTGSTEPDDDVPHRPDGLDLATSLARAAAGAAPQQRRARRRSSGRTPPRPLGQSGQPGETRRGRLSGAHPDERDPQTLDGQVERLVDERGWALDLRIRGVFARWQELVGDEIARHTTPEGFVEGRLTVRCDSTAWATQLRLLAATLVRRLNDELGEGTVTVIDVLGPQGPSWKHGPRSVRGRGPRDTYG